MNGGSPLDGSLNDASGDEIIVGEEIPSGSRLDNCDLNAADSDG